MDLHHLQPLSGAPSTCWSTYQNAGTQGLNQTWSIHYRGNGLSSILYEPSTSALPSSEVTLANMAQPYAHNTAPNIMVYGPQLHCIPQPYPYSTYLHSGEVRPIKYGCQGTMEAIPREFSGDAPQSSCNYPQPFRNTSGFRGAEDIRHQSCIIQGRILGGNSRDVDTQSIIPLMSPSNECLPSFDSNVAANFARSPEAYLQPEFRIPDERFLSQDCGRYARYMSQQYYNNLKGPSTVSIPSYSQTGLPLTSQARLPCQGSENNAKETIPCDQNLSKSQNADKKSKCSTGSLQVVAAQSIRNKSSSGQSAPHKSTKLSKDFAQPTNVSGAKNAAVPTKVWQRKIDIKPSTKSSKDLAQPTKMSGSKSTAAPTKVWQKRRDIKPPSTCPSKPNAKQSYPTHHIKWIGPDELSQPIGENCCLCKDTLEYPAMDIDPEYEFVESIIPEVAVLPCGHVYHSECLQLNTSHELARDPPCYMCINQDPLLP